MRAEHKSEEQIHKIAGKYGLTHCQITALHGGHANTSYLLQASQGEYVLTFFNETPLDSVRLLGRVLQWLAEHSFSTTRLFPTLKGKLAVQKKGKPLIVKHYIAGNVFEAWNDDMLRQVGGEMSRLHKIPVPDSLPRNHPYALLFPIVTESAIDPPYSRWLAERLAEFDCYDPSELPRGIIHGDIFWDNVIFQGQKLQAIIDFESVCHQPRVLDIGMAIVGTCYVDSQISWEKARSLVAGYQTMSPLEPGEKQALHSYVVYAAAITSCWRFWKSQIDAPDSTHVRDYQQLVAVADGVRTVGAEPFLSLLVE